jgi:predicted DCC family thiol-disulfide oxidoreductase YuxK
MEHPILLFDGLCGLCDRAVQFVLRHDSNDTFRFAPLQSEFAAQILHRGHFSPTECNTFVLVLDFERPEERLLIRSDAALTVLSRLGLPWKLLAAIARICPRALRDLIYQRVARNRYRIFGRYNSCVVPGSTEKHKFLVQ